MADKLKYLEREILNKVLNTGEDALKVDIDNVTLKTEGSDVNIEVHSDKAEDSMMMWTHTVKTGTGGTSYVPLVDADGHLQVDTLSSGLPSGAATAANQSTIIGHVDGIETLITSTNSKIDTADAVLDTMATSLGNLDNSVDGNYLNVNANIAGTDFVGGAGAVASGVQRVTLASDDPAVASLGSLDNAVDGNYLNVNANIAGTDMIGGAGAVASGVQRVTLASDDPAVASLGSLDNAVDGNYLNVNANIAGTDFVGGAGAVASGVQRVTLASDDPGVAKLGEIETTNNANQVLLGTIDSDTNDIKTATESSNTHLGNMFYDTALAVTPSDGSDLTGEPFYAVYVGTGGNLKVDMSDGGAAVTLSNVASGQLLPIMVERIYATGTTASNIIAFK